MRSLFLFILLPFFAGAQYAPPAGLPGSTAIYKDSSAIKSWASICWVFRGSMDISHPENGLSTAGTVENTYGKADINTVSLGDGGFAFLKFDPPIINGPGNDFAIFENGFIDNFNNNFLELAFVEVSSDSTNFYRFNSVSLTDTNQQTGSFGTLDATKINNLAGKYRGMFGTPFDLEELKGNSDLQLNNIRFVKIIDVVGSIDNAYASYDSQGHKINDPWPTPFESSGFDLDAVGIINHGSNVINENTNNNAILIYPNPAENIITIDRQFQNAEIIITNISGMQVLTISIKDKDTIDISNLPTGIYFVQIKNFQTNSIQKLIKN